MRYRIQAGTVQPQGSKAPWCPGVVTWQEGRITYVGPPAGDLSPVDRSWSVPTGIILPALYNGHNHAAMTLLRGYADDSNLFDWLHRKIFPMEARLTADDIYVGTLLAAAEMIRSGTAGFADMYFFVDAVAQAVNVSGLRGYLARGLVEAQDPDGEKLAEAVQFCNTWKSRGQGRIVGMLGPHAPYTCGPQYLEKVAEQARQHQLGVHIHLAETREEVQEAIRRYGQHPLSLLRTVGLLQTRTLLAHAIWVEPEDVAHLPRFPGGVVSCPISNAKLGSGIFPYQRWRDQGIRIGLGSDGAASTNTLDMFEEMKAMAWLQKVAAGGPEGFRAEDAFEAATAGNAEILGISGGRLQAGDVADFMVLEGDSAHLTPTWDIASNVVYAATGADVQYLVVDGRMVLDGGVITTFDEAQARDEARRRVLQWAHTSPS